MHICPVCGYDGLSKPAYGLSGNDPSYEICPSCYYEYGYDDDAAGISHQQWRNAWILEGMPWRQKRKQPLDWNPKKNLENIGIYLGEE